MCVMSAEAQGGLLLILINANRACDVLKERSATSRRLQNNPGSDLYPP